MIISHCVIRTVCRISSYCHHLALTLTHLASKTCLFLVYSFLYWIHQMGFITLIDSVVCSNAFIFNARRINQISCFLMLWWHNNVLWLHLLREACKLSINFFVLQTKGVMAIRKYVSLLEFSFILFNLHVHLSNGLLIKLLFTYLFNSIGT